MCERHWQTPASTASARANALPRPRLGRIDEQSLGNKRFRLPNVDWMLMTASAHRITITHSREVVGSLSHCRFSPFLTDPPVTNVTVPARAGLKVARASGSARALPPSCPCEVPHRLRLGSARRARSMRPAGSGSGLFRAAPDDTRATGGSAGGTNLRQLVDRPLSLALRIVPRLCVNPASALPNLEAR
jgi:hypothetical protein